MDDFEAVSAKTEAASGFEENVSPPNLFSNAALQPLIGLSVAVFDSKHAVGSFVRTLMLRQHRGVKRPPEDLVVGRNGISQPRVVFKDGLLIEPGVLAIE